MELIQISDKCYYINNPAKIGLIKYEDGVYLIDSGIDKECGRKIRQILDNNNFTLKGILNTHAHVDHIGGDKYLQNHYDVKVFANTIESTLISNTTLGPSIIYGSSVPNPGLTKLLYTPSVSNVHNFDDIDFPSDVSIIPLPGHSPNMVGFIIDDVAYIGDSVTSKFTLDKYSITYIYNLENFLNSLNTLETLECKMYVPAHADATDDIKNLTKINREKIFEILDYILSILNGPKSYDEILENIFDKYNIVSNIDQVLLIGSTIKAYLTYLINQNKITMTTYKSKFIYTKI